MSRDAAEMEDWVLRAALSRQRGGSCFPTAFERDAQDARVFMTSDCDVSHWLVGCWYMFSATVNAMRD